MSDTVFDQIHAEANAPASGGNVFDQIHAEASPIARDRHGNVIPTPPEDPKWAAAHSSVEDFKSNHPLMYGTMKFLFNDAVPQPGIMAMEGPLAAAAKPASEAAAGFFSKLLSHPKVIDAARDVASEFINEIPGVKTATKAWKGGKVVKGVLDDIRQPSSPATRPVGAAAMNAPVEPMTPRFEEMGPMPPRAPEPVTTASPVNTRAATRPVGAGALEAPVQTRTPQFEEMPESVSTASPVNTSAVPVKPPVSAEADIPAEPRTVDEMLQNLRSMIEQKHPDVLTPGKRLGEFPHGRYAERFDEGSHTPTIESTVPQVSIAKAPAPGSPLANNPKALKIAQDLAQQYKAGDMVHLKNGRAVTIKKLNGDGSFEH